MTMRSIVRRRACAALVLAAVSALAGCGDGLLPPEERAAVCAEPSEYVAPPAVPADSLFVLLPEPALTAEQEGYLGSIRSQPTTARIHVARLVEGVEAVLQADRPVTLNVSPTRSFVAVRVDAGRRDADVFSWQGRISGEYGTATLVLTGKGMTGVLQSLPAGAPSAVYSIHPIGGGLQAIVCVDAGKAPPDH